MASSETKALLEQWARERGLSSIDPIELQDRVDDFREWISLNEHQMYLMKRRRPITTGGDW